MLGGDFVLRGPNPFFKKMINVMCSTSHVESRSLNGPSVTVVKVSVCDSGHFHAVASTKPTLHLQTRTCNKQASYIYTCFATAMGEKQN